MDGPKGDASGDGAGPPRWVAWATELAAIAQAGSTYAGDVHDAARFERVEPRFADAALASAVRLAGDPSAPTVID